MKRRSPEFHMMVLGIYGMDDVFWPVPQYHAEKGYVIASPSGYQLIMERLRSRGFPVLEARRSHGIVGVNSDSMTISHVVVELGFVQRFLARVGELPGGLQYYAIAVSPECECP
jgi:hypothetical protein